MIFHLKGMTSSGNTSLCAVLTPNGLCGPRNAPGQGGTFQGHLLKHRAPPNPHTLEMRAGLGALVLMVQAQIPAVVDIIKCRFFCWTQNVRSRRRCWLESYSPPSSPRALMETDDAVSSFFQVLHSPSQQREGGNIARIKFHKFLCTNKAEGPDDRAEGEGESTEFLGIKSGANPQRRKIPLPPRAQCTVLATAETYLWALLSREPCEHLVAFVGVQSILYSGLFFWGCRWLLGCRSLSLF